MRNDTAGHYAGPRAKGWTVLYDGELVFSADADKWEDIGPTIKTIMTATDGTPEPTYTRKQVHAVINEAANLTGELVNPSGYESSESIAADSAMDMVVNLATYFLDHPGTTEDEAIAAQWDSDRTEGESDAELVERVKGWLLG